MLKRFLSFLPALAVCTLLAFTLNVGITLAEKTGILCCEMTPDSDCAPASSLPEHTSVCDCAGHLHPLVSPDDALLTAVARPLSTPSFAPYVVREPGNLTREITQPPRLS